MDRFVVPAIGHCAQHPRKTRGRKSSTLSEEMPVSAGGEALLPAPGGVLMRAIRALTRRADVDTAVAFAVLTKLWQIVNGLVTIVLLARYLAAPLQGFFYTF